MFAQYITGVTQVPGLTVQLFDHAETLRNGPCFL